jgi:hypothetical protein
MFKIAAIASEEAFRSLLNFSASLGLPKLNRA